MRDWGATCDGVADDTTALIQAGRASLDINIPAPLTCRVTGPLAAGIRSGQRWHGGGEIRTDDGFNFTVFSVSARTDVSFVDLAARSGRIELAAPRADARFIEFVSGADGGRVSNCRIEGFQQAIRVHGSAGIQVTGNTIRAAQGWGISIQSGAAHIWVSGNLVAGTGFEHGIYAAGAPRSPVRHALIAGNVVRDSRRDGIKLSFVERAEVSGNLVLGNGGQGIHVTDASSAVLVRRNLVQANADHGILLFDRTVLPASIDLRLNQFAGNRNSAIAVRDGSSDAAIQELIAGNETATGR